MEMIQKGVKGIHQLNPTDLNHIDKMKFEPSLKLMSKDLIKHLDDTVPGSKGTVVYLEVMRMIYEAFNDEDMAPIDRVVALWYVIISL